MICALPYQTDTFLNVLKYHWQNYKNQESAVPMKLFSLINAEVPVEVDGGAPPPEPAGLPPKKRPVEGGAAAPPNPRQSISACKAAEPAGVARCQPYVAKLGQQQWE